MSENSDEIKVAELESDLKEAISLMNQAQGLVNKVLKNVEKVKLMRD